MIHNLLLELVVLPNVLVLVVAHVILVSALGPNPSFFLYWGTFIPLGDLLGHGLGLGPELHNLRVRTKTYKISKLCFLFAFFMIRITAEAEKFGYWGHGQVKSDTSCVKSECF